MNRRRNLIIGMSAAIISGLLVYGVYVLQLKQIELQRNVRVVVPKSFVPAGVLLTDDMLEYKSVPIGVLEEGMYTSIPQITGHETLAPLGSQEPILQWKVGKFSLLPKPDERTFQIPKQYVLSVFNGIRAGDLVTVFASGPEGPIRLLDRDVTVAAVKTSGNVEVDNPDNPNLLSRMKDNREGMYSSRREANGSIDHINLNLTEQEWMLIDSVCMDKQAKLVIAFTAASIYGTSFPGE